jgi:hypothetical protein
MPETSQEIGSDEQRLNDAERELMSRHNDDTKLAEETFKAVMTGDSDAADEITAQRVKNQTRMHQLALAIEGPPGKPRVGLRYLAARAKYKRLAADLESANQRLQENGVKIRAQAKLLEQKNAELAAEFKKLEVLKANGSGHYEANVALKRHLNEHPEIIQEVGAN